MPKEGDCSQRIGSAFNAGGKHGGGWMLEAGQGPWYGRAMSRRAIKTPTSEKLRKELESIGGEPLVGSGFEDETPEPEFSRAEPADKPARS